MFFYSDGINTWTITYGNGTEDVTKRQKPVEQFKFNREDGQLYTIEKFDIAPDTLVIPPDEEWSSFGPSVEELRQEWEDEQSMRFIEGYKEWARDQKKNDPFGEIRYFDLSELDIPALGEQLEFDFVRQMGI